ncbi:MAG TPA: hypothetical protein VIJ18_02115 [Microbacteriaceae bacterium]
MLIGLAQLVLFLGDVSQLDLLITAVVIVVAAIIGFIWLGTTQTNRTKPWARDVARAQQIDDRFSQDPAAAARFGIYAGIIMLLSLAAFVVLTITIGFVWSWLALLIGIVVLMFVLARMLFPADKGGDPAQAKTEKKGR